MEEEKQLYKIDVGIVIEQSFYVQALDEDDAYTMAKSIITDNVVNIKNLSPDDFYQADYYIEEV